MRIFLTMVICALAWCLLADTSAQAQTYRFKNYTSSSGLPNNQVFSIYQDQKGYMWFGTNSGLCRYDGVNYTVFGSQQGLVDPVVRTVFEDQAGHLWITTRGGVSCWDGTHFTNYTTAEGLPHNEVRSGLCAHDGTLWFGTPKGLSHFDGQHFTNYTAADGLPNGPVWTLLEDDANRLWIGTRGAGLAKFDGRGFTVYGHTEGLPNDSVFDLTKDPQGGLWMATDGGLCHFDGSRFRCFTVADGLSSDQISKVLLDRQGRLWCSTFGGGLCRFEQGKFIVFNRTNGLPDNYLTSLYEDYEGNLWCGTMWSGVCRLTSEMFANYTAAAGIGEGIITGIAESPDGTLWFSSVNNGLSTLDPHGLPHRYGIKEGLLEEQIWTVYVDHQGRVWAGGQKGVSCYDGKRFTAFTAAQMGARERITVIKEDLEGRIWFGADTPISNGAIVYDGRQFTRYSTEQGLGDNQVTNFLLDHTGTLWACTEGGLSRFDGERFITYRREDGTRGTRVRCAYEDEQGRFWVGTTIGLCRLNENKIEMVRTQAGLENNIIRTIISREGLLWIGTARGLVACNGRQCRTYTVRDGLISNDITNGVCLKRRDGSLWFGTSEGAVCCRPEKENHLALPPRLDMTAIHIEGQSVDRMIDVALVASRTPPPLRYDQNRITFEFVGLSFADEESVRYSFCLEGFDHGWSEAGTERFARYTNLPPGRYRFFVKGQSGAGVWSEPQMVGLVIRPPFWQTWWFLALTMTAIVASVYSVYTWRIRRLERRHRKRIARLRQLFESIRVINSQLALSTVLQSIAEESARLVGGDPGGIGLVEDEQVVFKRLWLKDGWTDCQVVFPFGTGVAGQVAAAAKAKIVNDPQASPDIAFPELIRQYYVHGLMDVPIATRTGKIVGVLDVRRRAGRVPFTDVDCQLIEALASQAAVAIENAELYGELEEKNLMISESLIELERLYQQEQEVTHTLQALNQMKTNFMIVTSHEMRTPLTVLKGYTEAMIEEYLGSLTEGQHRALGTCLRMIDRMVTSFNDILEMLKINEGQMRMRPLELDLGAAIEQVLAEMATFIEKRRQHVSFDHPQTLRIEADRDKIQLVLTNLIQNAIKFTHDDGEIRIGLTSHEDEAHITVADTGIGVEPSEIERIFEIFYTCPDPSTHTSGRFEFQGRGTGLGLAIAKSYVEAHGGRIWAESAGTGQGTCFHVVLPFVTTTQGVMLSSTARE